jgi:hypothetical protein
VVWARDMDEQENRELLRYFKNRRVWLLEPDESPPKLSRYSEVYQGFVRPSLDTGVDQTASQ